MTLSPYKQKRDKVTEDYIQPTVKNIPFDIVCEISMTTNV